MTIKTNKMFVLIRNHPLCLDYGQQILKSNSKKILSIIRIIFKVNIQDVPGK